jgi:hypothetical protein
MGGTDLEGNPWNGGVPVSIRWESSTRTKPASLLCIRLTGKDGVRIYQEWVKGKDLKFKAINQKGITLAFFANDVNLKLVRHGVDSVFYIPNSEGNMTNIITGHACFTLQYVR